MSTLTALSAPDLLHTLLAEGRRKLEADRRAWEEEEEDLARRAETRRLGHWQALRQAVAHDLGEIASVLAMAETMPDDFASDAPLAEVALAAPGLAEVLVLYGYGEYWEKHDWDVAGGRHAFAVPTHGLGGGSIVRLSCREWHYTSDLALALALAEEEEARTLVELRASIEAAKEMPF